MQKVGEKGHQEQKEETGKEDMVGGRWVDLIRIPQKRDLSERKIDKRGLKCKHVYNVFNCKRIKISSINKRYTVSRS